MKRIVSFFSKRLFDRFKVIDLLLVLLVIVLAVIFYLFFSRANETLLVEVEYSPESFNSIETIPINYWIAEKIDVEDNIYDSFGNVVGKVKAKSVSEYGSQFKKLRLNLDLDVIINKKTNTYTFDDRILRIGDYLSVTIDNTRFEGKIISFPQNRPDTFVKQIYTLELLLENIPEWLVDDYQNFKIEKNEETVFEVIEILDTRNSQPLLIQQGDDAIVQSRRSRKDIRILAKVLTNCDLSGVCYFNENQPIKLGLSLWAQTNEMVLEEGTIVEVLEKKKIQ